MFANYILYFAKVKRQRLPGIDETHCIQRAIALTAYQINTKTYFRTSSARSFCISNTFWLVKQRRSFCKPITRSKMTLLFDDIFKIYQYFSEGIPCLSSAVEHPDSAAVYFCCRKWCFVCSCRRACLDLPEGVEEIHVSLCTKSTQDPLSLVSGSHFNPEEQK